MIFSGGLVITILLLIFFRVILTEFVPKRGGRIAITKLQVTLVLTEFIVVAGTVSLDKSVVALFLFLAHSSPLHADHLHKFRHHELRVLLFHLFSHLTKVHLEACKRTFGCRDALFGKLLIVLVRWESESLAYKGLCLFQEPSFVLHGALFERLFLLFI